MRLVAASAALFAAGCSLVVDSSDAPTGDAVQLPFADDFDGPQLSSMWSTLADNGDRCQAVEPVDDDHGGVLQCETDTASGGLAYVHVDIPPREIVRISMDVRFRSHPNQYYTFLQAFHRDEQTQTRLMNSDLYGDGRIDLWNFTTEDFVYLDGNYEVDRWYALELTLGVSAAEGFMRMTVDGTPVGALEQMNTGTDPINRVGIGLTLQADPNNANALLIDNVVIEDPADE